MKTREQYAEMADTAVNTAHKLALDPNRTTSHNWEAAMWLDTAQVYATLAISAPDAPEFRQVSLEEVKAS